MNYTTLAFFIFVCAVIIAYFLPALRKYQWIVLLAASIFFYCIIGFRLVGFIIFTAFSTWLAGIWCDRIRDISGSTVKAHKQDWDRAQKKAYKQNMLKKKRLLLIAILIINFGILVFLKYYNFLAGGIGSLLGMHIPSLHLFLPLGISFYTFQSMGYIIDVYSENIEAERNPFKFLLFVSFFPQIIQGPISSFEQLGGQLLAQHRLEYDRFKRGLELILWGYFKKLVIADRAVIAINAATADYSKSNGTTLLFVTLLYAFQLYADFSAGIDISRGIARILGIDMIDNFRRPYFSKSINEYWRRWHISLGMWMKQYIFYPIAMSDGMIQLSKRIRPENGKNHPAKEHLAKTLPAAFASLVVFLVVGLWHGANGKYVAFGLWNGLIIMFAILFEPWLLHVNKILKINTEGWLFRHFQIVRTFILVLIGYVFDIAPDLTGSIHMLKRMLLNQNLHKGIEQIKELGLNKQNYYVLLICLLIVWFVSSRQEKLKIDDFGLLVEQHGFALKWLIMMALALGIIIFGIYGPGYDPADFVYMQF